MTCTMRWLLLSVCCFVWGAAQGAPKDELTFSFGPFGQLKVYGAAQKNPADFVIFVSGDGGWKSGVVDMARQLSGEGAVVVGVDITHYQKAVAKTKAACTYAAADFENLSKFIQRKLQFGRYREPLLVGYSSGATLVYALLAQAPNHTFRGALSLGFCNDLILSKPLCARNNLSWQMLEKKKKKLYLFNATDKLEDPFRVLNGLEDKVCRAEPTKKFVAATKLGSITLLPKVGHGFAAQKNWLPQFKAEYHKLSPEGPAQRDGDLQHLPLIEEIPKDIRGDSFAILMTGDGGWAGIDRQIAQDLAAHGIAVIGWNSLQYLWRAKEPDEAAKDLQRVIQHYAQRLNKAKVRLIGYSLGADILPFMVNRLPADVQAKVTKLILLGPSLSTSFEFHVTDWLDASSDEDERPTLPELLKVDQNKLLCVYGKEEETSLCRQKGIDPSHVKAVSGGHHFAGDFAAISQLILSAP